MKFVLERLENIVGKGGNAVTSIFSFSEFPECFLPFPEQIIFFQSHLFCCLQVLSNWSGLKFCRLVKRNSDHLFTTFNDHGREGIEKKKYVEKG